MECKRIFPPGLEVNKTHLGTITLELFRINANQLMLLIPNDEKNYSFCIYPSQNPLSIENVLETFLKSSSESLVQLRHDGSHAVLEHVTLTNVTIYDLIKQEDLRFLSFSLRFVQSNFIIIKDLFFKYLNNLSEEHLHSLRNNNILKFYLAACIFEWKITDHLKSKDLVALSKEQFLAKTLFSNMPLQEKSWIYYSDTVLAKAAIHDIAQTLPAKRKLSAESTHSAPEYPNKKLKSSMK